MDLDGTLLDTSERHYRCYIEILGNNAILDKDRFWELKRNAISTKDLLSETGYDCNLLVYQQQWKTIIEDPTFLVLDKPYEGTIELLSRLKMKGYTLTLVTMRNNADTLIHQLNDVGFEIFLDNVISVDNTKGQTKSQAIIDRKGGKNNPVLWVGDTEQDICSAKELEIPVCAVANGIRNELFLNKYSPEYLVPSVTYIEEVL